MYARARCITYLWLGRQLCIRFHCHHNTLHKQQQHQQHTHIVCVKWPACPPPPSDMGAPRKDTWSLEMSVSNGHPKHSLSSLRHIHSHRKPPQLPWCRVPYQFERYIIHIDMLMVCAYWCQGFRVIAVLQLFPVLRVRVSVYHIAPFICYTCIFYTIHICIYITSLMWHDVA